MTINASHAPFTKLLVHIIINSMKIYLGIAIWCDIEHKRNRKSKSGILINNLTIIYCIHRFGYNSACEIMRYSSKHKE